MRNSIPLVALSILVVACDKEASPDAASSSSPKSAAAESAETVPAAAKGEVPPGEKMNVDGIPDAPIRGAMNGKEYSGKPYAFYIISTGELRLSQFPAQQIETPVLVHLTRQSVANRKILRALVQPVLPFELQTIVGELFLRTPGSCEL